MEYSWTGRVALILMNCVSLVLNVSEGAVVSHSNRSKHKSISLVILQGSLNFTRGKGFKYGEEKSILQEKNHKVEEERCHYNKIFLIYRV